MSYNSQCTHVPPGASGSSRIKTKLAVSGGSPVHSKDGETSALRHVCKSGIHPPSANAEEKI
jgi:hypothetical protein